MAPAELTKELDVARRLAHVASEAVMRHYKAGVEVEYKGPGQDDPVTEADREANRIIVAGLAEAFPDDAILAEESAPSENRRNRSRLWCVDPVDGTRDFIDRTGQFVVMIGLAIDGGARLGVVMQPTEGVLFWGVGTEAFMERGGQVRKLRPTEICDGREASMVVSRSHRSKTVTRVAETLGVEREEPVGSVGLKVARIAEGAAEIYLSLSNRTQEWDACAPEAILRAAGGRMTDAAGDPLRYNKETTETPRGMLASNGPMHEKTLLALQPILDERGWL